MAATRPALMDARELATELAQARTQLRRREQEAAAKERQLELYAADLRETFKEQRARQQELHKSYVATVRALSNAVEARDAYTAKHAERVAAYGLRIAGQMRLTLADDPVTEFGFLLHDIGKLAISDAILHKPGPLTSSERAEMQRHAVIGVAIVANIEFLGSALNLIRSHHERWDGRGYPDGLRAEEIPVAARVFAVADVLDALTTERPYREGMAIEQARIAIVAGGGTQFDPAVIAALKQIPDSEFQRIAADMR